MNENFTRLNEDALDEVAGGNGGMNEGMHSGAVKVKASGAKVYKDMNIKKSVVGRYTKGQKLVGAQYRGEDEVGNNWYYVSGQHGQKSGYVLANQVTVV